jgi:hypothetical protein
MSGTGASNFGYSNISPNSNINRNFVNVDNSQNASTFGSNEVTGFHGLVGAKSNVNAAAGVISGGAKKLKKKIKNLTKKYKIKFGNKKIKTFKKKIKNRMVSRSASRKFAGGKKNKRSRRKQRGGTYSQYLSNIPITQSFSVGGILPASQLALANPPPIQLLSNNTNCGK